MLCRTAKERERDTHTRARRSRLRSAMPPRSPDGPLPLSPLRLKASKCWPAPQAHPSVPDSQYGTTRPSSQHPTPLQHIAPAPALQRFSVFFRCGQADVALPSIGLPVLVDCRLSRGLLLRCSSYVVRCPIIVLADGPPITSRIAIIIPRHCAILN